MVHQKHERHIKHLKRHRNVLYGVVVVLLALQIVSFVSISSQISKIGAEQNVMQENIGNYVSTLKEEIQEVRQESQFGITTITREIADQKKDIKIQIDLLKSSRGDFSGIIEDSIKGVVSVITDISTASGFIITDDGYVVTNFHVLDGATLIQATTFDDRSFVAEIVGTDELTDLALLKIEGNFDSLKLADSDNVQIGEKVIAIGNPLGLTFSVTEGIVSAVKRTGPNNLDIYTQTDVALNPGNSGGPLINKNGEVIAMSNFKIGEAESLGFALESNKIIEQVNLIANVTLV
jgi:S1-C subfamily serine protease